MPGRFAFPVTGRIASACANIALIFQPGPEDESTAPLVERLQRELVITQQELTAAQDELHLLRREIESISGIKASSSSVRFANIIPARVVLRRDASNFRRTVLVNRGSVDGVRPGLPVLWGNQSKSENGLKACIIGSVDAVGPHACRVLLAGDPAFRVPGRMLKTRDRFVVEGKSTGSYPMRLKHVDTGTRIDIGDVVITSGSLGMFPPGFLIGTVAEVEGREYAGELEITLSSPVDLDKLESVIIIELTVPGVPEKENRNREVGK
jgi:rod shape-determining protein MreC